MIEPRIRESIEAYVAAWNEHGEAQRRRLLELACAEDVVVRTSGRRIVGRVGLDAMIADFQGRCPGERAVFTNAVDVQGQLFRFTGAVESSAGARVGESFDAGECDAEGRIGVLLTFVRIAVAPVT